VASAKCVTDCERLQAPKSAQSERNPQPLARSRRLLILRYIAISGRNCNCFCKLRDVLKIASTYNHTVDCNSLHKISVIQ
jgi:hypothetical protein